MARGHIFECRQPLDLDRRPTTTQPHHLGIGGGLVDEDQSSGIKHALFSHPAPARPSLIGRVPQGHWKTITFVAALRRNGMRAPCTIDGSMNGAKFLAYVEQCLAPTLKRKDIVMIDNLSAHKAAGISEAIEARYASLSAPVLARPQSHRDAVRQPEGVSAQGRETNDSSLAPPHCQVRLHPNRPRSLQLGFE